MKFPLLTRLVHFWDEEHSLSALLVLLLVHIFLVAPVSRSGQAVEVLGFLVYGALLLAGLVTMRRRRVFQVFSAIFVASTIVVRMARAVFGAHGLMLWDALLSTVSIAAMVVVVLWQVYREGPVTGHRLRGAIAAYLLIAVLFASFYTMLAVLVPGSFNLPAWFTETDSERVETFFYFSMVSLTTVGFGDITAIHPVARSLVMLEALIGQLFPAILIARLVTLQMEARQAAKGGRPHGRKHE